MIYTIRRLSDGVVVGHVACPPKNISSNTPEGCEAIEGATDLPQVEDLEEQVRSLAREEIDRLERSKIRALTDHALAPEVEIEIGGRRMSPRERVMELEVAIAEQRKRL